MRAWIYGIGHPEGNEQAYLDRYRRHNDEVREYFRSRPDDLLVMDITQGDGWAQLSSFLGTQSPSSEFPNINSRANQSAG